MIHLRPAYICVKIIYVKSTLLLIKNIPLDILPFQSPLDENIINQ